MKKILSILAVILVSSYLLSCNKNLTDEEKAELYSKSTTREDIIKRSGTKLRAGTDDASLDLQMSDAENRLITGGGLFGKGGLEILNTDKRKSKNNEVAAIGFPVNPYLWKGSLDTIEFMSLLSADPFAGIIITDWYTSQNQINQRCKLNIFIKGAEMKTDNLKVNSFCQTLSSENNWVDEKIDNQSNHQLENAILNRAKKLKLSQG